MLSAEERVKLEKVIFDLEEVLRDTKKMQSKCRFLGMVGKAKALQYDVDQLEMTIKAHQKRLRDG